MSRDEVVHSLLKWCSEGADQMKSNIGKAAQLDNLPPFLQLTSQRLGSEQVTPSKKIIAYILHPQMQSPVVIYHGPEKLCTQLTAN